MTKVYLMKNTRQLHKVLAANHSPLVSDGIPPFFSVACSTNNFECSLNECIPNTEVCDGIEQCSDGSDENSCGCKLRV